MMYWGLLYGVCTSKVELPFLYQLYAEVALPISLFFENSMCQGMKDDSADLGNKIPHRSRYNLGSLYGSPLE